VAGLFALSLTSTGKPHVAPYSLSVHECRWTEMSCFTILYETSMLVYQLKLHIIFSHT